MKNNFSDQNSHAENMKVSVDKILGQSTTLRKVKKGTEDYKKSVFCKTIEALQSLQERSFVLMNDFEIDLTKYEAPFFTILDLLLEYSFNKEQINLINFYMYDRYTPDGQILGLVDNDGESVPFETPEDLYNIIKTL